MMSVAANVIAKSLGFEPADLSDVPDPKGRLDYLASKLIEQAVLQLLPSDMQATYHAARPVIDGYLLSNLGKVKVQIPKAFNFNGDGQ